MLLLLRMLCAACSVLLPCVLCTAAAALLLCMLCCGSATADCLLFHSPLPLFSALVLPPSVCPFTTPTGTHTLHTSTDWLPQRSVPAALLGSSVQKMARPSALSVLQASTPVLLTELRRAPGAQQAGSRHIQVLEADCLPLPSASLRFVRLSAFALTLTVLCDSQPLVLNTLCTECLCIQALQTLTAHVLSLLLSSVTRVPYILCTLCALYLMFVYPGTADCLDCPIGRYAAKTADERLDPVHRSPGGYSCRACQPGTFAPALASTMCTACAVGT